MTTRTETPNILDTVLTLSGATPAPPAATLVALTAIVNDGGTQMRAGMDAATITEYADALAEADAWPFPPIVVFHDGEKYWLADGFHRVNAAHRSGKFSQIPADVRAGTRRDAILHAAGANAAHGLRRTNGDKRRSVEVLLRDEEWSQWSDREIAKRCLVSHNFVSELRKVIAPPLSSDDSQRRRIGADGRTINTQNIGTNRPARLFVNDLKGLVAKWMGMHWQHAWPDNPSHTNGEFWQSLVAWMHENVRETWQEGDLKEAIKALHWLNRPELQPAAPAPSQRLATAVSPAPTRMEIFEIEQLVRKLADERNATPGALRLSAREHIGPVWQESIRQAQGTLLYRDLAQAMNNVASQMEQRPATASAATDSDLHTGAGRTPAPPLTVAELVEDLDGYLTGIPATEIDQAAKGAQNRALMTAQQCLSDFTYRQADLYRALQRLALQRGAAQPAEPVVDGDRPLPAWAAPEPATVAQTVADVVAVHGEAAPVDNPFPPVPDDLAAAGWELRGSEFGRYYLINTRTARTTRSCSTVDKAFEIARGLTTGQWSPEKAWTTPAPVAATLARHPQYDDLFEFAELFKLAIKETHRWAHITGEHTAILEAERGLRHLVERTAAILDGFTGQP
jgi:hypothetical protein